MPQRRAPRPCAPDSIDAWIERWRESMAVRGQLATATLRSSGNSVRQFASWCAERAVLTPAEVTRPLLERWQRHLYFYRKADGGALTAGSQVNLLQAVRLWFRWLVREHVVAGNPAADLELPRASKRSLREPLSELEAEAALAVPDTATRRGLRDRTMLELLYATGIRRRELMRLEVGDLDFARGTLFVRQGKGRKDRMVPLGERAAAWLERYLRETRPTLAQPDDRALFVGSKGGALASSALGDLVRHCFVTAGIDKRGACHLFRHTMATLMLDHGADVRYVQEMLGHASLETTQVYTHVSLGRLKAVHAATHPGAKLVRRACEADDKPGDSADREA